MKKTKMCPHIIYIYCIVPKTFFYENISNYSVINDMTIFGKDFD